MKKALGLLLALLLMLTAAYAETEDMREFYNPEHYSVLRVTDAWLMDDDDYVVQANFGEIDYTVEEEAKWIGFDEEKVFTLVLAKDAVIEMPESIYSVESNVPSSIEGLDALVCQMREELNNVELYCHYEMTAEGVLTKLIYSFYPF